MNYYANYVRINESHTLNTINSKTLISRENTTGFWTILVIISSVLTANSGFVHGAGTNMSEADYVDEGFNFSSVNAYLKCTQLEQFSMLLVPHSGSYSNVITYRHEF